MSQIFPKSANYWSKASIIMLLEVPVGVFGAVLLLGESMGGLQWLGAAVAVVAVVVAVIGERR